MRRFRFSISGMMVVIVLLCVAGAALRYPTPFWANIWFSLTLATLVLAVPAAVYRRGEQRAFWVGFATCGWVYFILTLVPWFQTEVGTQLATTTLLDVLAPRIVQTDYLLQSYWNGFNPQYAPAELTAWQAWNVPEFLPEKPWRMVGYATLHCPGLFLRIGHAVFCVVIAFLGGEAVRYLASKCPQPAAAER
jgi:hypothetical protein